LNNEIKIITDQTFNLSGNKSNNSLDLSNNNNNNINNNDNLFNSKIWDNNKHINKKLNSIQFSKKFEAIKKKTRNY